MDNKNGIERNNIDTTQPDETGFSITKEFLEITFGKQVERFEVNLGTNPGDNYMSVIHAVEIIFQGEAGSNRYLVKCYPSHPGRRDFLDEVNLFANELFMYENFFGQLKKIVVDKGAEKIADFSFASFHGGNVVGKEPNIYPKPWCDQNFIVFADLRTRGYQMADRIKGLDLEQAMLVMKEIARLHSVSWAYKQINGLNLLSSIHPKFADNMYANEMVKEQFSSIMEQLCESTLRLLEESLGSDHPGYKNFKIICENDTMQFIKRYFEIGGVDENLMEGYLRVKPAYDENYAKAWQLLNHGDLWINNMLFRKSEVIGKSEPESVIFVDFQIVREACPTLDLAYFMYSSIRAAVRNPNLDTLLQTYHDTFVQCCEALGVSPLPGFSFETLKRRYRRAEIFGVLIAMPMLSIVLKPEEESLDLDKTEGENMGDLFSSVIDGSDKNEAYKREMVATVLNLHERGIL